MPRKEGLVGAVGRCLFGQGGGGIVPGRVGRPSGHLGGIVGQSGWVDALFLGAPEEIDQRPQEPLGIAQRPIALQPEREQVVAQQHDRLRTSDQPDVARQPELEGVLAHEPVTQGMEGVDRGAGVAVGHQQIDSALHLLGRGVGKGEREDLAGARPSRGDEPRHATSDDLRLAGARTGDDEHGPVAVGYRATLLAIEPGQQLTDRGQADRRLDRNLRAAARKEQGFLCNHVATVVPPCATLRGTSAQRAEASLSASASSSEMADSALPPLTCLRNIRVAWRECRLDRTKPSPRASSIASTKDWLEPVSSNGL